MALCPRLSAHQKLEIIQKKEAKELSVVVARKKMVGERRWGDVLVGSIFFKETH